MLLGIVNINIIKVYFKQIQMAFTFNIQFTWEQNEYNVVAEVVFQKIVSVNRKKKELLLFINRIIEMLKIIQ